MSGRQIVADVVSDILRRAHTPALGEIAAAESVQALQLRASRTLDLVSGHVAETQNITALAEEISGLCAQCLDIAGHRGLSCTLVAELVSESLAVAASFLLLTEEEAIPNDRALITGFFESLGEAVDRLALEIFEGIRRMESILQSRSNLAGQSGCADFHLVEPHAEVQYYTALQSVCVWTMRLLARAVGDHGFCGNSLWEFASRDALCAFIFTKEVLCFQRPNCERSSVRVPHDFLEFQDAVLHALLALADSVVAFHGWTICEEQHMDIAVRNEQLLLHRAFLASAAAEVGLLDALLAYPWNKPSGNERLLEFASFVADLTAASSSLPNYSTWLQRTPLWDTFLRRTAFISMNRQMKAWPQQILLRNIELWSILTLRTPITRDFIRDCATLAYYVQPPPDSGLVIIQRALADRHAVLSDACMLAAVVVLAANSGWNLEEGSHPQQVLRFALTSLDSDMQTAVAGRLQTWHGCLHHEALEPWAKLLSVPVQEVPKKADTQSPVADVLLKKGPLAAAPAPSLHDLVHEAPSEFRCALDSRLLVDPVRSPAGYVFERSTLAHALHKSHGICPLTGSPLTIAECPRDANMRQQVVDWIRQTCPRQRPS